MEFNQDSVQALCDRLGLHQDAELDVMNEAGLVIASTVPGRIGSVGPIAPVPIGSGAPVSSGSETAPRVVLPLMFGRAVVGSVAYRSDREDPEVDARSICVTLECLYEQEHLHEKQFFTLQNDDIRRQRACFTSRLLSLRNEEEQSSTLEWATKLGYDLKKRRAACLFIIDDALPHRDGRQGVPVQNIVRYVKQSAFYTSQDLFDSLSIRHFVVFKTVGTDDRAGVRRELSGFIEGVRKKLSGIPGIRVLVGAGFQYADFTKLKESFMEAQAMVEYARRSGIRKGVLYIHDHVFEFLIGKLPRKTLDHFLGFHAAKLDRQGDPDLLQTINSLAGNNMNIGETAQDLNLHRNSVVFRIRKVRKLLGVDPLHNDSDRILFRLLALYLKYRR